jgi:hypothetical protein
MEAGPISDILEPTVTGTRACAKKIGFRMGGVK